jgi:hypothetical protein
MDERGGKPHCAHHRLGDRRARLAIHSVILSGGNLGGNPSTAPIEMATAPLAHTKAAGPR